MGEDTIYHEKRPRAELSLGFPAGEASIRRCSLTSGIRRWNAARALLAAIAHGQAIAGRLPGTIRDSSQAVVPGAVMTITNEETGIVSRNKSDAQGNFIATCDAQQKSHAHNQ
jgi:hypothetical protein